MFDKLDVDIDGTSNHMIGFLEGRADSVIATPAVAEKGHFDLRLEVSSPGGHSSVPPEHTVSSLKTATTVTGIIDALPLEHWHSCSVDTTPRGKPVPTTPLSK